jgi:DNA-binding NarL/FixJ family response regulator
MDAPTYAALRERLRARQAAIGQAWHHATVASAALVLISATTCDMLVALVGQIIEVLLAKSFDREAAYAIGRALPLVLGAHPRVLGTTLETLASELTAGLQASHLAVLQPRLAALLGEVSAGFLAHVQEPRLEHPLEHQLSLANRRHERDTAVHQFPERSSAIPPIRVFLADHQALSRAGVHAAFAQAPELLLVGEAADGALVRAQCQAAAPHVIVLDLDLPRPTSVLLLADLRAACPATKLLILTAFDDDRHVRDAFAAGVDGYVLKDADTDTIVRAIRAVAHGDMWLSQAVVTRLARWAITTTPSLPRIALTQRDIVVLGWIVDGKSNREIATLLRIGEKAVEKAVSALFAKLAVTTRVTAAVRALRDGLLEHTAQGD